MKLIRLALIALALTVSVSAQKYSTPQFSATFNCSVTANPPGPEVDKDGKTIGTSTGYWCGSTGPGRALQTMSVTKFDHDIAVDSSFSDAFEDEENEDFDVLSTSKGNYQGHPFTYVKASSMGNDQLRWHWSKLIVVNARTTIWIMMNAPAKSSDDKSWQNFANSLEIK